MRYRYIVTIDSDHDDAMVIRRLLGVLLDQEGFDVDQCLSFECERTAWEPVDG